MRLPASRNSENEVDELNKDVDELNQDELDGEELKENEHVDGTMTRHSKFCVFIAYHRC